PPRSPLETTMSCWLPATPTSLHPRPIKVSRRRSREYVPPVTDPAIETESFVGPTLQQAAETRHASTDDRLTLISGSNSKMEWRRGDSNPRPPACKAGRAPFRLVPSRTG